MRTHVKFSLLKGTLFVFTILFFGVASSAYAAISPTLGAAGSYSILSGAAVTNTGPTSMPGNLGVSPGIGVGPHYSGFPPGSVGPPGSIHDTDANASLAQADNTTSFGYIDQNCTVTYQGTKDLSGENLVPGVYCAGAFALSGTLTLNGTSGVWIFKSASTLVTTGEATVLGGDPCNVWWRVVSSATLGTGTTFVGNILAYAQIAIQTGATLNGRAMTQTAAVTLDSNTITGANCLTANTGSGTTGTHTDSANSAPTMLPSTGLAFDPWTFWLAMVLAGVITFLIYLISSKLKSKRS
jgi:hypothetical protein